MNNLKTTEESIISIRERLKEIIGYLRKECDFCMNYNLEREINTCTRYGRPMLYMGNDLALFLDRKWRTGFIRNKRNGCMFLFLGFLHIGYKPNW